jgi:L-fuconolactonase
MIDTHTHIVADDHQRYPLKPRSLSGEWYLEAPHTASQLLACMDDAGVEKAVVVQAVGAYTYENDYAADSGRAHPDRFASACCIDPLADGASEALRYWISERGMQGVRLFAIASPGSGATSGTGASWLGNPKTFAVWHTAAELGAHVIVTILGHQLAELQSALRRFPDVHVSLDHCGFPDVAQPEPLFALADEPNLSCKVSSIVLEATSGASGASEPFVEALVARFGAERIMWGSDFCQTHDRSYGELVSLARAAFSSLSAAQQHQCFVATPLSLWPSLA